ncbi:hypothetical protein [Micromonospora polyrhachis]|uniref:Uncharacterized protein n=1 Tax=Micromonospora polyrhachis TaxID=1282883 RepID=A0A7W7SWX4_9ACTN|nr:hypothetical protein [Micromonospora polyrhachis]MBB4962393.1 hypothetical protein [Micromonospora polyrhachis]
MPRSGEGVLVLGEEVCQAAADADDYCREALRISGEMMMSHMQAAAQHLSQGREQLARTMDRLDGPAGPTPVEQPDPGGAAALPRNAPRWVG